MFRVKTAGALGIASALAVSCTALYCWGDNGAGQLGNGTTTFSSTPARVGP